MTHIVRHPKKVKPYLIFFLTDHLVLKNQVKWRICGSDYRFAKKIMSFWMYHFWVCLISEATANAGSSIFAIYALLVTYPWLFREEFLLWSSWMFGGNDGGSCRWQLVTGEFVNKSRKSIFGSSQLPENSDTKWRRFWWVAWRWQQAFRSTR